MLRNQFPGFSQLLMVAVRKVLRLLWGTVPFFLHQTQNVLGQIML